MSGEFKVPFSNFLSYDERLFLKEMRKGLDNQIQYTRAWLNTDEGDEILSSEDFYEDFYDSTYYDEMVELMNSNTKNCIQMLDKFYQTGADIANGELNLPTKFNKYDKEAFRILQKYVGDLIYDVNVELANGIKENLYEASKESKTKSRIMQGLVLLPFIPLVSNISVDTRCKVITCTEYGRAVNTGTLQSFANAGIRMVEIVTAGDDLVCDDCIFFEENNPYTLEEAANILPVHTNCRCGVNPLQDSIASDAEPIIIDLT